MNKQLTGQVIHGNRMGHQLGFPTANINAHITFPAQDGVYAVCVTFNQQIFHGMANLGYKPTVNGKERLLEVHLFGFSGDLYNHVITVTLLKFIRPEEKFNSIENLARKLQQDRQTVEAFFRTESNRNK